MFKGRRFCFVFLFFFRCQNFSDTLYWHPLQTLLDYQIYFNGLFHYQSKGPNVLEIYKSSCLKISSMNQLAEVQVKLFRTNRRQQLNHVACYTGRTRDIVTINAGHPTLTSDGSLTTCLLLKSD